MQKNRFPESFQQVVVESYIDHDRLGEVDKELLNKYLIDTDQPVLEAGTGAGVNSFYVESLGFKRISAYDLIPQLVERAKEKAAHSKSAIEFRVADAASLDCFDDGSFGYLLHLQQVFGMIHPDYLDDALDEAVRIGKPGAIYLFSFMDWNSRWINPLVSVGANVSRLFRGEKLRTRDLPELTHRGRLNRQFFNQGQHCHFWAKESDVLNKLRNKGLEIVEFRRNRRLISKKADAMHVVCKKP